MLTNMTTREIGVGIGLFVLGFVVFPSVSFVGAFSVEILLFWLAALLVVVVVLVIRSFARWPLAMALIFIGLAILVFGRAPSRPPKHTGCQESTGGVHLNGSQVFYNDKPVIYLYPEKTQAVTVQLTLKSGELSASYPEFDTSLGGWRVTATKDGELTDQRDGKRYSYLFWESENTSAVDYDLSKGFVVKGSEVRDFLHKILPETGLTPKEYNEFIVYWYPRLMNIPLMQIYFGGKEYTESAPLTVQPRPDSMLRVFMVVRPLKEPVSLSPQKIPSFDRKGFSVVEWGGALLP